MMLRRQRGAFTPIMGAACLLLGMLTVGGVSIGRLTLVRTDSQRCADAAGLAAAQLVRDEGMPFDGGQRARAELVANGNTDFPVVYTWDVEETPDAVDIEVTAAIDVSTPFGIKTVSSRSKARVAQSRFDEAERRLPKLVLVLDYSGSMSLPFVGGGSKIAALEASVAALLARGLMIDYGGVFYSSSVFRTVGIGPSAPGAINGIMATYGAGGGTNTTAALLAARNLLTPTDDTGWYVLLVSDGQPNSPSSARNAAVNLWNNGITIFTLEIRDSPPIPALAVFMTDVAGSPSSRRDPSYHFVAETAADLADEFDRIVASIVCRVGPLDPAPTDTSTMHVYLDGAGGERPVDMVPPGGDLADFAEQERWFYDAGNQTVRLTMAACDAVIEDGDDIVVRFDSPTLVE